VTPSRAAVIQAVAHQPRPFTAGELCAAVAEKTPAVGRATVFRTLDLLETERVVDRLHSMRGRDSYVLRDPTRGDKPHHYLVCDACDGVTELDDPVLRSALHTLTTTRGFRADGSLVEVFGRCRSC
jgi:Fur family ferric uptake transcriptional regulator